MRTEHDTKELGILAAAISAECAAKQSGSAELAALATRVREILQRANRLIEPKPRVQVVKSVRIDQLGARIQ